MFCIKLPLTSNSLQSQPSLPIQSLYSGAFAGPGSRSLLRKSAPGVLGNGRDTTSYNLQVQVLDMDSLPQESLVIAISAPSKPTVLLTPGSDSMVQDCSTKSYTLQPLPIASIRRSQFLNTTISRQM